MSIMTMLFGREQESSCVTLGPVSATITTSTCIESTPPAAETPIAPYGETFGNLTRFGDQWISLKEIRWVDFSPVDGCGAEVWINGNKRAFHLSDSEAAALKLHMMESHYEKTLERATIPVA